ncbi:ATP-dependent helicase HrpB [Vibrio tritonius]|uniref:ATP-dependent helicase HrpB n=1 Tax=Vibrio tritonius TaxID=1435069 RepID=UPI00315D8479
MSQLPIADVLPQLLEAVQHSSQTIVKAEPGAGKSTFFPLQLLLSGQCSGKIVMLEPRRIAARNIATYLAEQLGEKVGQRVGYRIRGETRVGPETQLEIVTEGIMTRMVQSDPELTGIDVVIFDEFHERSLHADTALAFCLEVQAALRDDLTLVVMSATLDQQALLGLLPDATYIHSSGRQFPVDIRHKGLNANERMTGVMAKQIESLLKEESGSILAFLPGAGAINQVMESLTHLPSDVMVCPLYGQLSFAQQQKALAPAPLGQRKVVLATNIAETSLTIEGIRIVVDSGLERVARFDPKTGITRLIEGRCAQSSATQRAGRAGRLEPGICVRLYSESQGLQQPKTPTPEIMQSDLTALALELAFWGAHDVSGLAWLDLPPKAALAQARDLLQTLGLMKEDGQLTSMGRQAHQLGVDPRLAAMLLKVQAMPELITVAIALAAIMEEPEKNVINLSHSVLRWQDSKHPKSSILLSRAKQIAALCHTSFDLRKVTAQHLGLVACLAFPDRVAMLRPNSHGEFVLSNGHGAMVDEFDGLASEAYLVVLDIQRHQQQSSRIFSALPVDIHQLEALFPELFMTRDYVDWDDKVGKLVAEKQICLGKLTLQRQALPTPSKEKMTQALLNYVSRKGLNVLHWDESANEWLTRVRCAINWLPEEAWPAMDEASLLATLNEWLGPYLVGLTSAKQLSKVSVIDALAARLGWPLNQQIDEWLPKHHVMPTGTQKKIRYQLGMAPILSVRMQEVFGEKCSPIVAKGTQTVVMELLSPAQRPLQITQDLAGFWQGAYKEVQKEMKGRYPKHVWPDDPANHIATTKTKRQLNS